MTSKYLCQFIHDLRLGSVRVWSNCLC